MEQTFERVAPGLYRREYATTGGESSVLYYGRIKRKRDGKRELFALGSDLREAKDKWTEIKIANRRGEDLSRFKSKKKGKPEPETDAMTFRQYAEIYLAKPEAQSLKSHRRDCDFGNHLNRHFGEFLLTDFKRRHLFTYRDKRLKDVLIRNGKPSTVRVGGRGEVTNELWCLRKILRAAEAGRVPGVGSLVRGQVQ